MEELDIASVTRRSIHGIFALVSRTITIQIIGFIANFLLSIKLSPSTFGVYYVVTAAIGFLSYFSDIGLAAALIQKKDPLTSDDLRTSFTIQQALVISVSTIALLLSSRIGTFYHLQKDGIFLFQALAISFFLSSLKTIPSIILERDLHFEKLVIPQITETVSFSIISVVLAFLGFGVSSFTYAVLARGIIGLVTIYLISPWRIQIGISKQVASRLFSFGIPFQLNSFLALIKDDLLIAYLGKVLPLSQVGYIGFAQKWAFQPLRLVMDNVIRVTFPSFSRLQHDQKALAKAIEKSLFAASFVIFPSLVGLTLFAPYLMKFVPRWVQWQPALFSLIFFAINASLSSISTPLTNALNAIGKIKITFYLMIFWTVTTWILTPIGISLYGFNAVSFVSALIACSVFFVVYLVKRSLPFHAFDSIRFPLLGSLVLALFLILTVNQVVTNIETLLVEAIIAFAVYGGFMYLVVKDELMSDLALVIANLKRK